MSKQLWDKYFLKMRILVYLQLGLIIYSGFAAYSVFRDNLQVALLMSVSIVGAGMSIFLIIKSAADSLSLEHRMNNLGK